jgi:anti-sigma regulatory factor (Ser/Thr protein kinase)
VGERLFRDIAVDPGALGRALDALETLLREAGLDEAAVMDLRLAAEEVLVNVASYSKDPGQVPDVRMSLTLDADAIRLEFRDDGRPFDPLQAPPPDLELPVEERPIGGLGIHMALALVDAAEYARVDGRNVLRLTKRR